MSTSSHSCAGKVHTSHSVAHMTRVQGNVLLERYTSASACTVRHVHAQLQQSSTVVQYITTLKRLPVRAWLRTLQPPLDSPIAVPHTHAQCNRKLRLARERKLFCDIYAAVVTPQAPTRASIFGPDTFSRPLGPTLSACAPTGPVPTYTAGCGSQQRATVVDNVGPKRAPAAVATNTCKLAFDTWCTALWPPVEPATRCTCTVLTVQVALPRHGCDQLMAHQ
jgi:hypothetical protein